MLFRVVGHSDCSTFPFAIQLLQSFPALLSHLRMYCRVSAMKEDDSTYFGFLDTAGQWIKYKSRSKVRRLEFYNRVEVFAKIRLRLEELFLNHVEMVQVLR